MVKWASPDAIDFQLTMRQACSSLVRSSTVHVENSRGSIDQTRMGLVETQMRIVRTQQALDRNDSLIRELHRVLHF